MRILLLLCFFLLLWPAAGLANAPDPDPPPAAAAGPPPPVEVDVSAAPERPELAEIIAASQAAIAATKDAHSNGGLLAWLLATSAIIWALVLFARRWLGLLLSGRSVRVFAVVGGAVAAGLALLGGGMPIMEALVVWMAGPGGMALNEVLRIVNPDIGKVLT